MSAELLRRAADRLDLLREHAEYPSPWDEPLAAWLRSEECWEENASDRALAVARAILGDDA